MTDQELKKFRGLLLGLGRRLRGEVAQVTGDALRGTGADPSGGLSNLPVHPADLGNDAYQQEVAVTLLENESLLLRQVGAALRRIEDGTYGRCQECGRDMPLERLEALPYATHCLECANRLEEQG
jgi:RNA polymerase-binding transcription factor DksA